MKRGYARVSTNEQNPDLQVNALREAGCDLVYVDEGVSGSAIQRPGLDRLLVELEDGDTLIVWELDRLGRSLQHLLTLVSGFRSRNIDFTSLTEQLDTSTPGGRVLFSIMGALSEFERDLIRDRTRAGLEAARRRGAVLGRPRTISGEASKRGWLRSAAAISRPTWKRASGALCSAMRSRSSNCSGSLRFTMRGGVGFWCTSW